MPTIRVRCSCGQEFLAEQADAGKGIRCRCGRVVPIPGSGPGRNAAARKPRSRRARRFKFPTLRLRLPRASARLVFPRWVRPTVLWLNALYFAGVLASVAVLWVLGDRWWPATVLTYGPRWLLLLPALPLAVIALFVRPRVALFAAAGLLLTLGPVMGYRTGWRTWFTHRGRPPVRVVTFNLKGADNPMIPAVPVELARLDPDLMLFQECPPELPAAVTATPAFAGWTVRQDRTLCLGSRWPVDSVEVMEEVRTRDQGGTGTVVFYSIRHPDGAFGLANLHLETPGKGLEPLREGGEARRLIRNSMLRDIGSRRASRWIIGRDFEALMAGDFNLTVESAIYQAHWSGCPNAFSRTGRGFGWTRILKRFAARIDHVITCGSWTARWAEVGPDLGSDHRPLVVDLERGQGALP